MDAPPADAAPSPDLEASDSSREAAALVRYYRIDFQRCVIRRGRRERQSAPEKR
ncbi:MAG: hypothetical protein NUW21_04520 [Elusimicrobia bacterium]|nr:hypothetical protein [Elusimicrobiota bacterium]